MQKVMIAIITYNGDCYIEKCINSVISHKYDVTIAIVDNGSTDGTKGILNKFGTKIKTIFLTENVGFGQGNNILLNEAIENEFDYIYLLNQDAYFVDNSLDDLIDFTDKLDSDYITSPIHLKNENGEIEKGFKHRLDLSIEQDGLIKTNFINAAAWLIPISIVRKVGGFSPLFFHYGEDNDYAQRLIWYGYKFVICPTSFVVHDRVYKRIMDYINDNVFFKKVEVYLLTCFSNINYGAINVSRVITITLLGLIKKTLIKGKFIVSFKLFWNFLLMLKFLPSIRKHRVTSKKEGAFL